MHDPVTPMLVQPAVIGWEAKKCQEEPTIERAFSGEELVRRMKGWVTVDPSKVIETIRPFGRLKILDDRELVIEFERLEDFESLQGTLKEAFGSEMDIDLIAKK